MAKAGPASTSDISGLTSAVDITSAPMKRRAAGDRAFDPPGLRPGRASARVEVMGVSCERAPSRESDVGMEVKLKLTRPDADWQASASAQSSQIAA